MLPTADRIRLHYDRLGLRKGWRRDRFNRLCQLLHCTPEELAALCCIEMRHLNKWLCADKFPAHVSLHFAIIESAFIAATTGRVGEPIMPINMLQ